MNHRVAAVYDSYGNQIAGNMWQSYFDLANAGVAWTVADVYYPSSDYYCGDKGQGWIWMTTPLVGSVYLRAKLTHTWQGGSISDISINSSELSVTISPETEKWNATNPFTLITSWPTE